MNQFISGRKNCHLKGLNSYVLRERISPDEGMLRIFHNTSNCLPGLIREGKYTLAPHNHRQDITLFAICGSATNINFAWDSRAPEKHFREWVFRSEIVDGEISAHYHDNGDLRVTGIEPINCGGIVLPSRQIHTVIASRGSAWLVMEGALAPQGQKSLCYSIHSPFVLSNEGLYENLTQRELDAAWDQIGQYVQEALK